MVSDILGHKKVNLAMDVYDRTDVEDFVQPLPSWSTSCDLVVPQQGPPQ